jgi:hypothetical protein
MFFVQSLVERSVYAIMDKETVLYRRTAIACCPVLSAKQDQSSRRFPTLDSCVVGYGTGGVLSTGARLQRLPFQPHSLAMV